ncbi:MAG: hypothetical protein AAGC44_07020 [Planctomycetota bacterium]
MPIIGTGDVAFTQQRLFGIAVLVEHEPRVVAVTTEVPVVRRALPIAMRRADGTVHVEDELLHRLVPPDLIDSPPRQIRE